MFYLSILLLINMWAVSTSWLLGNVALNIHGHVFMWTYVFILLGRCLGAELLGHMVTLWVRQWVFMSFINMHRVLGLYLLNMWGCVLFAGFSELTAPLSHVRRGNLGLEAFLFEHRRGWEGGEPLRAMSPWTNPLKQPPLPIWCGVAQLNVEMSWAPWSSQRTSPASCVPLAAVSN